MILPSLTKIAFHPSKKSCLDSPAGSPLRHLESTPCPPDCSLYISLRVTRGQSSPPPHTHHEPVLSKSHLSPELPLTSGSKLSTGPESSECSRPPREVCVSSTESPEQRC